jgi:SAM-dependent methyltransferase
MDEQTLRYYETFASDAAERYNSAKGGIRDLLSLAFAPGMRVLDVGAGSGRDMRHLLEMGIDAYGVDPSDRLRAGAVEDDSVLRGRLERGGLPDLGQPFGGQFDGVLCSAVLMHLPRDKIFDSAFALRSVLKENGRLLISVPLEGPTVGADNRDSHGRLFTPLQADFLELLFERLGFRQVGRWCSDDALGRAGRSWCALLFQLWHGKALRPIDEIEGILSRDKKTATYKLALFRALSEIATTEFEQARWIEPGIVGIPVRAVCEKWLYYYWPVFESSRFVPQIRGETDTCQKPIAFRRSLSELIDCYRKAGGFVRFVLDWRSDRLTRQAQALLEIALKRIRYAIVTGPVTYAGGSLETGRLFQYDATREEIRVPAAIWRELSLLGHWIEDAIVLRWAELTSEICRGRIMPSEVIDLLLVTPLPERDVSDARATYVNLSDIECAWSGERISNRFQVDHIIPFSLWHNNDLWNLVPVLPSVNAKKGDRLPTRELLLRRKDYILHCWEALHLTHAARFEHEACRVVGTDTFPQNWQHLTFRCVAEGVEVTAIQRSLDRWQP